MTDAMDGWISVHDPRHVPGRVLFLTRAGTQHVGRKLVFHNGRRREVRWGDSFVDFPEVEVTHWHELLPLPPDRYDRATTEAARVF